jgi:predicted DNA-binding transcriptional regulator AlpA
MSPQEEQALTTQESGRVTNKSGNHLRDLQPQARRAAYAVGRRATPRGRGGPQMPTSSENHTEKRSYSPSRWLTIREIAADLDISLSTAYKWSARGEPWFPRTIRLHNGDLRIRGDWYDTWLCNLERNPQTPGAVPAPLTSKAMRAD